MKEEKLIITKNYRAARETWKDTLTSFTLVEPSENMQIIARELLSENPSPISSKPQQRSTPPTAVTHGQTLELQWKRFLFEADVGQTTKRHDLVVASYSMSEILQPNVRRSITRALWDHVQPGGYLALIEPGRTVGFCYIVNLYLRFFEGTPMGFAIVREARELLRTLRLDTDNSEVEVCNVAIFLLVR